MIAAPITHERVGEASQPYWMSEGETLESCIICAYADPHWHHVRDVQEGPLYSHLAQHKTESTDPLHVTAHLPIWLP
jgi:hypothetical protein